MVQDVEASAIPQEVKEEKSPLKYLRYILRIYAWAGVFPADFDKNCYSFKIRWIRYFPMLLAIAAWITIGSVVHNVATDDDGVVQSGDQFAVTHNRTRLDDIFAKLYTRLNTACFLYTVYYTHKSIPKYDELVVVMKSPRGTARRKKLLAHHFFVILCNFSGVLCLHYGSVLMYGADFFAWDTMVLAVRLGVGTLYVSLVISTPELIFVSFTSALSRRVQDQLQEEDKLYDPDQFSQRQRGNVHAFKRLSAVFGKNLFSLFFFTLAQLIFTSYYAVMFTTGQFPVEPQSAYVLYTASYWLFLVATAKRIIHLANYTQRLLDRFDLAAEKLSVLEAEVDTGVIRRKIKLAKILLMRIKGLPVLGFFHVDRSILLAILSQLFTYLIIMIEFTTGD